MLLEDTFVCLDCETTGLDSGEDRIIEIALARFNASTILDRFETLIDPECPIPETSIAIHHINDEMVRGKPKIQEVLPHILSFIDAHILVGHGIALDIAFLCAEAKRHRVPCTLHELPYLDTLRLARLYGQSPINSLEMLRRHFNISDEGAHRAMNDVTVNIEVFKFLTKQFKTTEQIQERLKSPILLKAMPLGKYKGRPFSEIPMEYLQWASKQKFDQDLLFSLKNELKRRKRGKSFEQMTSPFSTLS